MKNKDRIAKSLALALGIGMILPATSFITSESNVVNNALIM